MLSNINSFIDVGYSDEDEMPEDIIRNMLDIFHKTSEADVYIVDASGNIIIESLNFSIDEGGEKALLPEAVIENMKFDSPAESYADKIMWQGRYIDSVIVVAKPVFRGTEHFATVLTAEPVSNFGVYYSGLLRLFMFSALLALIIDVVITYYLVYRTYKPIKQLSAATKKIAAGDYSYRVDIDGDDEFVELGEAFNSMAKDLATLENSRRNFIANISHELKTPMTTIGGFIDGIMDGTIPPEKQDKYLGIVSNEVKRLSRLVIAMLNLSKIEAGELKLEKKQVNASEMVFEILLSFEQIIERKGIDIRGLDTLNKIMINADPDMIYQVIYNLVDNAVKFTDKGGYMAVGVNANRDKFVFMIRNKCAGISGEDLNNIFERFYKADKSRSTDGKGFGLGLYIAKTIVEMHGGQITARSHDGESCEFIFWIPIE